MTEPTARSDKRLLLKCSSMAKSRCNKCGADIPEGAAVCPLCGTPRPKGLPVALILAFFVIGSLLGLLFVDSDYYYRLRQTMQGYTETLEQTPDKSGLSHERKKAHSSDITTDDEELKSSLPAATAAPVICNSEKAERVRRKALEIAELSESEGILQVRLRQPWAYYTPGIRQSFLEAFAESDACLAGHSREIQFYYRGKMIAIARVPEGLSMVEQ